MGAVPQKNIFVVLGMSRTGTSAIARSLKILGVELGEKFLPANKINPKGFWEDVEIMYKVNRGVSAAVHQAYLSSDSFDAALLTSDPLLANYHQNAVNLLKARLQQTQNWGFKDPRTITLMPFWKSVFKALHVEDRYVITVRHPLSAAMSNCKFIDCKMEEALLIWLRQLFAAIEETHDKKRVIVSYEAMLQDPRKQVERMHRALGMTQPLDAADLNHYADEFLDKKLKHYSHEEVDLANHPTIHCFPLIVPLYELLKQLANDEKSFDDADFQATWQAIKTDFLKLQPMFHYIDSVQKNHKQLEKMLTRVERSFAWKLLYPLRVIDQALRVRRDERKTKKRLSVYEAF